MEPTPEQEPVPEAFEVLAEHLSTLGMGFPTRPDLYDILRANLSEEEAALLCLLPTRVGPLELATAARLAAESGRPEAELARDLEALTDRGMLYRGTTESGERGYALLQVGFGFPQTFFWKGEATPHATKMAGLVSKYFGRKVTHEAYAATETKPYRYVPVRRALETGRQAVLPHHSMESVLQGARRFAVAHCPCRVATRLKGVGCEHPEEVCLKFDELADFVIERGL
ncbi:MAG: hypothetical protein HGA98_04360, partial [Deltaproteobacteria bacterium]|nr:hypothetical protein [Deltaproteobacteria bacterium]